MALVARTKKFKAPTQGMENIYYTQGTSKYAEQFMMVTTGLSNYVGTQSWTSASTGAKAMRELKAPTYPDMEKPVRMYWEDAPGLAETNKRFDSTTGATKRKRTAVLMYVEYTFELQEFMDTNQENKNLRVSLREINGKIYNLLLLHSAPDVVVELRNHVDWDTAESVSAAIMLLDMLRDITHNLKENKQGGDGACGVPRRNDVHPPEGIRKS